MAKGEYIISKFQIKLTNIISSSTSVLEYRNKLLGFITQISFFYQNLVIRKEQQTIINKCNIIGLIVFILSATESYGEAWLPEVGTYNLYSSHSYIDGCSEKRRNKRKEEFIAMQDEIQRLSMIKYLTGVSHLAKLHIG